jgi:hypothetical protein
MVGLTKLRTSNQKLIKLYGMKKSLLILSLGSFCLSTAFGQTATPATQATLKFDVPANTSWSYVQKVTTKTEPLEPVFTPEAGKKIPAKLEQTIKNGLRSSVSATRNVITEKVVGVKDGSSTVAVSVTSTTAAVNIGQKPTKQISKWSFNRVYTLDGKVSIRDFKFDTTNVKEPALTAYKNQSQNTQNTELARYQQLYGLPLTEAALVGSNTEYSRNVFYDAKKPGLSVKVSSARTFKGRGGKNEYIFKTSATVGGYNYKKSVRKSEFNYVFDPAKSNSQDTYLPDGRLQSSSGTTTSASTISYLTTFTGVKVTVKLGFTSTTETTTELQPQ